MFRFSDGPGFLIVIDEFFVVFLICVLNVSKGESRFEKNTLIAEFFLVVVSNLRTSSLFFFVNARDGDFGLRLHNFFFDDDYGAADVLHLRFFYFFCGSAFSLRVDNFALRFNGGLRLRSRGSSSLSFPLFLLERVEQVVHRPSGCCVAGV